jgi:CRP-like cAMP-binding protein
MSEGREVTVDLLRSLAPLEGMKRENLHALARKVVIKQMPAGRLLFKEGENDKRTVWVASSSCKKQIARSA